MATGSKPEPGDVVKVTWIDITEDSTGDEDDADPYTMVSRMQFIRWRTFPKKGRCLILGHTRIEETGKWYGVLTIPKGAVRKIEILVPAKEDA